MTRRIGVGALAHLRPTFVLGFVWHVVLFTSQYDALATYRHDVIIEIATGTRCSTCQTPSVDRR